MNKKGLSIATMTWARDKTEENLLRESLEELAASDLSVFITDGGSGKDFLDFVKRFSNFILLESKVSGVWPQVQNSLAGAYTSGSPFILYTEPDKKIFFKEGLSNWLAQAKPDEQSGIVVAARSAAGFASYPAFQRMTETTINNCCAEITGKEIDYTYGPFIMNRALVPSLNGLKEQIGWGWRPYVFMQAHRLGYKVEAFEGDYFCPADQQQDSAAERLYRMRQLSQNIEALVL